ncbi:hypothetical protein [Methylobacterium dankookense]|uniref:Uncharacterized protein n=1 Tax=Methylobacterium dankookense TaxID=560405 RepID=A0A564FX50_9HYPH|nr:hypothetical protein [Methylobacterium dankookense]GJD57716.1 hypothetical protein IFDJLNFL_3628 [Methylobacterium dankookense]VUF12346.1 hypothetical protein MTDSW087_02036 [Methylobacterium dankookense]
MPKRRVSKPPAQAMQRDPDHRPEQGDVERAIASALDHLKPRARDGQGAKASTPGTGKAVRKPRPDPER